MELHPKKRVEIIVEMPALKLILRYFDDNEISGYTVKPASAGRGASGRTWTREGLVSEAGRMMVILVIIDEARLEEVFDGLYALVDQQIGIIAVSDCTVVRKDRF